MRSMSASDRLEWVDSLAERVLGRPFNEWFTVIQFNTRRRIDFYEDLRSFVSAGLPPFQALGDMLQVSSKRRTMRWLTNILRPVIEEGRAGKSLPQAMRRWLPNEEAALLMAGEQSGDLEGALNRLIEMVGRKSEIRTALMKELVPTGAILVVLIAVMYFVQVSLLTLVGDMLPPEDLVGTSVAKHYIAFATFMQSYLLFLVVGTIVAATAVARSMSRWRPSPIRQWLDEHVPPWSMYQRQQSTFFLVAAAAMMRAGTPFKRAVVDLQSAAGPWLRTHMRKMLKILGTGASPVDAMQTGILPWEVADRLATYRRLQDIAVVMESTGISSLNLLLKRTKSLGNIAKVGVMLLFAGFILATLFTQFELSSALEAAAKRGAI